MEFTQEVQKATDTTTNTVTDTITAATTSTMAIDALASISTTTTKMTTPKKEQQTLTYMTPTTGPNQSPDIKTENQRKRIHKKDRKSESRRAG